MHLIIQKRARAEVVTTPFGPPNLPADISPKICRRPNSMDFPLLARLPCKFCLCQGLNSCPPDQEFGALIKELASPSGSRLAYLQSSLQYPISGVPILESKELLWLLWLMCGSAPWLCTIGSLQQWGQSHLDRQMCQPLHAL